MRKRILPAVGVLALAGAVTVLPRMGAEGARAGQGQAGTEPYVAPVDVDTAGLPGPTQPIFYRHDIHAGEYEMDCRYCHFAVEISTNPGLPTLSTCMGCHLVAGRGNPEVEKLVAAYNESRPVEWLEVHTVAPFVRFPHMIHVNADLECQECHGPIERMPQVYQYASLKMGWCVTCHEENDATTDCTTCHY